MKQSIRMRKLARVGLINDSSDVLEGLQAALSKSHRVLVVGTARTEDEAIAFLRACRPDVVVLDVRVGRVSGIKLCEVIRESYPKTAVLFFTADDDQYALRSAILAGAQGYLLKGASDEAIMKGIEVVAAGQAIIDQRLTQQLLAWIREGKRIAQHERIEDCSRADLRVLPLLQQGKATNKLHRSWISRRVRLRLASEEFTSG